jgi:hypothetical protein
MTAISFIATDSFEQRETIRHNWQALGYAYWFTGDMIEYWRHPATKHTAQMTTY